VNCGQLAVAGGPACASEQEVTRSNRAGLTPQNWTAGWMVGGDDGHWASWDRS
jgi:hypothetical protein